MQSLNCALVGIFDDRWQGRKVGGLLVQPLARAPIEAKRHQAKVAVLANEEATAPSVVESLIEAGIKAVLNLTPSRLEASANVAIEQADIGSQLLRLLSRME
jgi:redox-sensing transcriptional repressor